MNGQMYQVCLIAAAAKKALKTNSALSYSPLKYENKIEFLFMPEKSMQNNQPYIAESVSNWYTFCVNKELQDIKYLAPVIVNNRTLLGFSNTTQSSLVCFYKTRTTCFTPYWEFDSAQKMWNVLYTEHEWEDAPAEKLRFENNTESFKTVLLQIKELALKINSGSFAGIFQKSLDLLLGSTNCPDAAYGLPSPEIPTENLRLFNAASTADVFGAMGSWNDSPPYMAHEKGLSREYDSLSAELLKQIRLATLYAINEW